ncbi:hypothetical protein GDO81_020884 [Engystomops pustulosus]|uniref:G-protein coupled receptors family 1 profile domain-containing protein n=1 Tax=Engystomops pustulosus TaxID=76066 RepID=A0AAV6YPX7_ENGPU|nr:hypothetical protein GDO81_020884 [Engystomops pustulosus]
MENQTIIDHFEIMAFSNYTKNRSLLFSMYLFIYLIGLQGNITIIICVVTNVHLHKPMYISLSNLSTVDMMFTSSTLSKLMDLLLTANNSISYVGCFTQMWFFMFSAVTEDLLLSFMAYDRYVAICKPLYYHMIMNSRNFMLSLMSLWMLSLVNASFITLTIYQMDICHSNKIQHFFCEIKAFDRILCANTKTHLILFGEVMVGFVPFLLSLTSYIKIISVVLSISSMSGRKKAFSTCTSHLTVLVMFYMAGMCMYLKLPSEHLEEQDLVFSTLFTSVIPMLNPMIYSLRNEEVKEAIRKLFILK